MWGSLLSHRPRSCRKIHLDPAHTGHFGDSTQHMPQGVREDPWIWEWSVQREQPGMESLLSWQGTDLGHPHHPHTKLGLWSPAVP